VERHIRRTRKDLAQMIRMEEISVSHPRQKGKIMGV
jgi:hypothetical protein